ncbi:HDOD domain-containing protein [Oryzomonas japonica]|uniref:HDOD domain-containing protein n=1 Tax=Oryzomonas japonica TaxID=2603858 RepID=UPI00178019CB|nr:HDOD domain-containing protein [Oryzomonas japonica]
MDKAAMMIKARKLFKDVSDLPTIPVIVSRVIRLLDDHESNPDEVADLILSDQVLAARVIRVVNSPLYMPGSKITSVKRALLYLGFRSVREMILTSYFVDGFKAPEQPFDMNIFWMHSFSVGSMSRRIAAMVGYNDTELAYMVGIIHDIGKVFFGHYLREEYGEMLAHINYTRSTTYDAELEYFGTTHSEVGLCLAQRWNFPPVYSDVISHHHTSELAIEDPLLTAIVALADFFCLAYTISDSVAQATKPDRSEEYAWNLLKQHSRHPLPDNLGDFFFMLSDEYVEVFREVNQLFNTMTTA